jgi:hypothetical protein
MTSFRTSINSGMSLIVAISATGVPAFFVCLLAAFLENFLADLGPEDVLRIMCS